MSERRVDAQLPPTPRAPGVARHAVAEALTMWGLPSLIDTAQLVATEMVTNAVQHVGGTASFGFTVQDAGDVVRLALSDGSALRPLARELTDDQLSGRGVALIEALSERWGVEDHQGGKQVWVALRKPPRS